MGNVQSLPADTLGLILIRLSARDIINVGATCLDMHSAAQVEWVWKELVKVEWNESVWPESSQREVYLRRRAAIRTLAALPMPMCCETCGHSSFGAVYTPPSPPQSAHGHGGSLRRWQAAQGPPPVPAEAFPLCKVYVDDETYAGNRLGGWLAASEKGEPYGASCEFWECVTQPRWAEERCARE